MHFCIERAYIFNGGNIYNMKFTILTILCVCTVRWHLVHSHCCITISKAVCIFPKWNSIPRKWQLPFLPSSPAPRNDPSTFCLWKFDVSRWSSGVTHLSGVIRYLFFCAWLISLSIMSPRFTHVLACSMLKQCLKSSPSFLRLNNIPLYAYTTFFSHHSSIDTWVASTSRLLRIMLLWIWVYRHLC